MRNPNGYFNKLSHLFHLKSAKSSIQRHLEPQAAWTEALLNTYCIQHRAGGWYNIKMSSYQYRKSHYGDKTILRPSYPHNRISYTGKIISLYWNRALVLIIDMNFCVHFVYIKRNILPTDIFKSQPTNQSSQSVYNCSYQIISHQATTGTPIWVSGQ